MMRQTILRMASSLQTGQTFSVERGVLYYLREVLYERKGSKVLETMHRLSHAGVGSAHHSKFRAATSKLENIKIEPHFKEHYYILIAFNGISMTPKY